AAESATSTAGRRTGSGETSWPERRGWRTESFGWPRESFPTRRSDRSRRILGTRARCAGGEHARDPQGRGFGSTAGGDRRGRRFGSGKGVHGDARVQGTAGNAANRGDDHRRSVHTDRRSPEAEIGRASGRERVEI